MEVKVNSNEINKDVDAAPGPAVSNEEQGLNIKNFEEQINKVLDSINPKFIRVSFILSQLDFSEFGDNSYYNNQFPRTSILKLYLFRIMKGLNHNYVKLELYLNTHEKEAFELGFLKDKDNKLKIPDKRTYNHRIKNEFTDEQKKVLNLIAATILDLSSKKGIVLDLAIVKAVIKNKIKNYDLEKKDMTQFAKKLVYPLIDLNIPENAKFKKKELLDVLVYTACNHAFANGGGTCFKADKEWDTPSGELVLKRLSELKSKSKIKGMFTKVLDLSLDYLKKNYNILKFRKFDIAYDVHQIKYWGETIEYVGGGKPEDGVTTFFNFLTCSIVVAGYRFILDVVPIHPLNSMDKLLDESLKRVKNRIRVDKVYLDRWFCNVKNIKVLNNNKLKFVMPIPHWETVKARFFKDQLDTQDVYIKEDFIIGKKNDNVKVNLFLIKSNPHRKRPREYSEEEKNEREKEGIGEKHAFIANFKLAAPLAFHIYGWYSQRWGIETSYRQLDYDFLSRTTSRNYNIRLFHFLFSCTLYNLWVFVNIKVCLILYGKVREKPIIQAKLFGVFFTKKIIFDDDT